MRCEGFTDKGDNCPLEAEAECESCGQAVCTKHGRYHTPTEQDEHFVCNDCEDEAAEKNARDSYDDPMDDRDT